MEQSKQHVLIAVNIAFTVSSCMALLCRLVARKVSSINWWWDDFFAVFTWALVITDNGLGLWAVSRGLGRRAESLGPGLTHALYATYFDQMFVHPCLASIKFTVLLFYARMFVSPGFRKAIWVAVVFTWLWLLGTLPVIAANCIPVKKIWLGSGYTGGHCVNLKWFLIGQGIANTLLDMALLALPLSFVWRLQMTLGSKIALSCAFSVGIFELCVSIIRLAEFTQFNGSQTDPTYDWWQSELWSRVEINVGFICVCMVASGPLIKSTTTKIMNSIGRTQQHSANTSASSGSRQRSFLKSSKFSPYGPEFGLLDDAHVVGKNLDPLAGAAVVESQITDRALLQDAMNLDEIHMTREVIISKGK